jgi:hypothetical protein
MSLNAAVESASKKVPFEVEPLKDMTRLMGHADENIADFVRGTQSEVCCDCDTALTGT